uniref:Uncharacterized protein n=1 Tax=Arundo donax TaxID=35708 RepID=A0A0A9G2E3_ARUDO
MISGGKRLKILLVNS